MNGGLENQAAILHSNMRVHFLVKGGVQTTKMGFLVSFKPILANKRVPSGVPIRTVTLILPFQLLVVLH